MTKFADQLFTDLMLEHRSTLRHTELPAATGRRPARRRAWLAAGAGTSAAAITAGLTAFGGSSPAYAVTQHADGTVTVAVTQLSGIAGANAKLHALGDRVVVVPVEPGCPSINSLSPPAVSGKGHRISTGVFKGADGSVTVNAQGVPAGDLLVLALSSANGTNFGAGTLTSGPAPSCVSVPRLPPPGSGSGSGESLQTSAG